MLPVYTKCKQNPFYHFFAKFTALSSKLVYFIIQKTHYQQSSCIQINNGTVIYKDEYAMSSTKVKKQNNITTRKSLYEHLMY